MSQTILIVEDEVSLMEPLARKLTEEGYSVLKAENGEVGLQTALEKKPDLILLDIIMPVMDGITMLKKLRATEIGKSLPVIILTNLTDDLKMQVGFELDAKNYLVKSDWKLEDLVAKIKERMQNG